jgi:hypothetical protein
MLKKFCRVSKAFSLTKLFPFASSKWLGTGNEEPPPKFWEGKGKGICVLKNILLNFFC